MNKEAFMTAAGRMYEELSAWRGEHKQASYDEIAAQVTQWRQRLMGQLLAELAEQEGQGEYLAERSCPQCGGVLHYKGKKVRGVGHAEGSAKIERGYHHCDQCGHGFFPSGPDVATGGPQLESGDAGQRHPTGG